MMKNNAENIPNEVYVALLFLTYISAGFNSIIV